MDRGLIKKVKKWKLMGIKANAKVKGVHMQQSDLETLGVFSGIKY